MHASYLSLFSLTVDKIHEKIYVFLWCIYLKTAYFASIVNIKILWKKEFEILLKLIAIDHFIKKKREN